MFERFANCFNTFGSCAMANESASMFSFCNCDNSAANNNVNIITVDNAVALSIFVSLRLVVVRLCVLILNIINTGNSTRPVMAPAR